MQDHITILKEPALSPGEDYSLLRKKGMEYIEQLGKKLWTDYNIHDPGITILELLCYAITDLGYRTSLDIKDIIAEPAGTKPNPARQAFYTAREILTTNPWTKSDYRKLLIDVNGIKNAWLFCKECPCDEMFLYANCSKSILQYTTTEHEIIIKGLYDVLVEFEDEESVGDLNSGKIKYNFSFLTGAVPNGKFTTAAIEMRLPDWQTIEKDNLKYKSFRSRDSQVKKVTVKFISGNKNDNVNIPQAELARAFRKPLYATLEIEFMPDKNMPATTEILLLEDIPFHVWFRSDSDKKDLLLEDLADAMADSSASGIISKYLDKIKRADQIIALTKMTLHSHRNLCEDFCTVKAIAVEDVAICADIDVTPDADIEKVLAQAYYLIDQYFSPNIKFYSLKELLESGTPVESIFEGPQLSNGFIDNAQLESTQLKTVLYTSDIINLLMDIPGVTAVRNLVLTRYDKEGNLVESQPWSLDVSYQHQPRLYIEGSKFLVFKNGLPFLPDKLELIDTMQVIKGQETQPKYSITENDLPVPEGTYYDLNAYHPLQHSLPQTYGTGHEGLPPHSTEARRAQAKQLKAYLMFFEQTLVNYLSQLSHVKDLFALDTATTHTYYSRLLGDTDISKVSELYVLVNGAPLDQASLDSLAEDDLTFLDRRNRFLDHLLARFSEQFSDYALMLYAYSDSKKQADEILINDKIDFLKEYPFMSRNKGRSFNYKDPDTVCNSENIAGLMRRIERLLGLRQMENYFQLYEEKDIDGMLHERRWRLVDQHGKIYLSGSTRYTGSSLELGNAKAKTEIKEVIKYITDETRYEIKKEKKWVLNLLDSTGEVIATRKQAFSKKTDAEAAMHELIAFAKDIMLAEKIFIVEHLLLRPRNKPGAIFPTGDPLLPICISANCELCGEEDPYSFRMTIVMNGESGIANSGIEFRRFAEQTIRLETPAHLGLKICWVGNEQMETFEELYCDWLSELAKAEQDTISLHDKLVALLNEFTKLKSVYPKASLHDCADGDDENRVYLNQTIV